MKVLLSPDAEQDLTEACEFIARDSPAAAMRLLERFGEVTKTLAAGLIEGLEVTLSDGRTAHSWPLPPYRIYYRRSETALEVLRVYHLDRGYERLEEKLSAVGATIERRSSG